MLDRGAGIVNTKIAHSWNIPAVNVIVIQIKTGIVTIGSLKMNDNYEKVIMRPGSELNMTCPCCGQKMAYTRPINRATFTIGRFKCFEETCPISVMDIYLEPKCHWYEEG